MAATAGLAAAGRDRAHRAADTARPSTLARLQGKTGRRGHSSGRPEGGARIQRHKAGRRSKRQGVTKITRRKSIQRIAEERVSRKYPNLRVLNSYWVGEDGSQKWHEVILVDPEHPAMQSDDDLGWICDDSHRGRAFRGKSSAGQRGRGLQHRGKGTEHTRPSQRSNLRKGN